MSIRKPAGNLSSAEKKVLQGFDVPEEIRNYAEKASDDLAARLSAYQKIASLAAAEARALFAVRSAEMARDHVDSPNAYRTVIHGLQSEVASLESQNAEMRRKVRTLTAAPALAVHSGTD